MYRTSDRGNLGVCSVDFVFVNGLIIRQEIRGQKKEAFAEFFYSRAPASDLKSFANILRLNEIKSKGDDTPLSNYINAESYTDSELQIAERLFYPTEYFNILNKVSDEYSKESRLNEYWFQKFNSLIHQNVETLIDPIYFQFREFAIISNEIADIFRQLDEAIISVNQDNVNKILDNIKVGIFSNTEFRLKEDKIEKYLNDVAKKRTVDTSIFTDALKQIASEKKTEAIKLAQNRSIIVEYLTKNFAGIDFSKDNLAIKALLLIQKLANNFPRGDDFILRTLLGFNDKSIGFSLNPQPFNAVYASQQIFSVFSRRNK